MRKTLVYGILALLVVGSIAGIVFLMNGSSSEPETGAPRGGFFDTFFPFGGGSGSVDEPPLFSENGGGEGGVEAAPIPALRQISADPVSGAYAFQRDGVSLIRFIDRATGHVFETEAESATVTRITNTTVPGIYEVLWTDENNFIVRYVGSAGIESFNVSLDPDAEGEQSLGGRFMESFSRGSLLKNEGTLFGIFETEAGSEARLFQGNSPEARVVFTSPIASWVPLQTTNNVFLQTAPASGIDGFFYQIVGGELIKVAGDIPGLSALINTEGTAVALGEGDENRIELQVLNTQTGEARGFIFDTIPEKCVFAGARSDALYCGAPVTLPPGNYPNDWLLGYVGFTDTIVFLEPTENRETVLTTGEEAGERFDVWQPTLTPDATHFIFINKNDLSLWSLRLSQGEAREN
jgi:hypothetical protein